MKKKILTLLLVISLTFLFAQNVSASTDINSFTIDVEAETGNAGSGLTMKVNGDFEDSASYYAKFVNENDPKPTIPSKGSDTNPAFDDIKSWKDIISSSSLLFISGDWYMLDGYDYVYILKCDSSSCILSDKPIKVDRPELPELSKRYSIGLYEESIDDTPRLDVFPLFPETGKNGSHEIEIKIGIINDNNLLYKIYKNESGALESLVEYAKNNSGTTYSLNKQDNHILKLTNLNLSEGSYYYLYTNYKNDDGMYRDLSDITIAQVKNGRLSNDINYNDSETVTNVSNNTVTKNPSTKSENIALIASLLLITISVITLSIIKLKKVNKAK